MDTLIQDRSRTTGPNESLDERLTVTEQDDGKVDIDLRLFDQEKPSSHGPLARSFVTLPAEAMQDIVERWTEKHPAGLGSSS